MPESLLSYVSAKNYTGPVESQNRSQRLSFLKEQLSCGDRRSALQVDDCPANEGFPPSPAEQIPAVSSNADATVTAVKFSSDIRLQQLSGDFQQLLKAGGRAARPEHQAWQMQSQDRLMRRLRQVLQQGSPGTDVLWQLCALIAEETQSVSAGMSALPEPDQRLALSRNDLSEFVHARKATCLSVFTGMAADAEVSGADLVAAPMITSPRDSVESVEVNASSRRDFCLPRPPAMVVQPIPGKVETLVELTNDATSLTDQHCRRMAEKFVSPSLRAYYGRLTQNWPSAIHLREAEQQLAHRLCAALGLTVAPGKAGGTGLPEDEETRLPVSRLRLHSHTLNADEDAGPAPCPRASIVSRSAGLFPARAI